MLIFKTHFESMLAVNLGEIVGNLKGRTDLVRGQEGITAKRCQAVDSERRESPVLVLLGNVLNTIRCGYTAKVVRGRRNPRSVKVIEPRASHVDHTRRE